MERVALLAGSGSMPLIWAKAARKRNLEVVAISFANKEEQAALRPMVTRLYPMSSVNWREFLAIMRRENLEYLTALGKFDKKIILKGLIKDLYLLKIIAGLKGKSDDQILNAFVAELNKEGIKVLPQREILTDLLPRPGILAGAVSLPADLKGDIELAWQLAKAISRLGIGQVVAVKEGIVLAVEALEGTDATIRRATALAGEGIVVAKVAWPDSPGHGMELPVVGQTTLAGLLEGGARALVIEAHKTMILNGKDFLRTAREAGLLVLAKEGPP